MLLVKINNLLNDLTSRDDSGQSAYMTKSCPGYYSHAPPFAEMNVALQAGYNPRVIQNISLMIYAIQKEIRMTSVARVVLHKQDNGIEYLLKVLSTLLL